MNASKLKIAIALTFFAIIQYTSQIPTIEKQSQNIASPEVASIMKYADFPQLDYIGKTNISVPIYDINFGKIQIPIHLSYNTKGNKVADIATSVGLGWNLNASGNLTLKVNDTNDLIETYTYYTTSTFEPEQSLAWHRQSKGYLSYEYPKVDDMCLTNRIWWNDDIFMDSSPDFYYINAPGLNDKFYLTRLNATTLSAHFFNTKSKLNNNPNLTIQVACKTLEGVLGTGGSSTVFYGIDKFEITGENGYIYTFNKPESSIINDYTTNYYTHNSKQINNWCLTRIKDPGTGKEIIFEYEYYSNPYEHLNLKTDGEVNFGNYPVANNYELGTASTNDIPNQPHNRVTGSILIPCRLTKIITNDETVEFSYTQARLDYPGNSLNSLIIKNKNSSTIKQVDFAYDYFNSQNCSGGNYECKRLKLSSINDSSLGIYGFYYDSNNFPARNSSKVDFLGYYNNNDSNIIFTKTNFHEFDYYYPNTRLYFYPLLPRDQLLPFQLVNKVAYEVTSGVDRTAKTISKLGLLQRIVYPTGGSLQLNYENDEFMYEGANYILGSTRISNMKFFNSGNLLSKEVNYKYLNEDGSSSGQINFLTTPSNVGKTEIASGIGFNTGAVIGYSRIIEEVTGKGYVERKFSNFSDYPDRLMKSDYQFTDQPTLNFLKFLKFPNSYVQSFDDRRGKLITENYYKHGITAPIKRNSYEYNYLVGDSLKVQKTFTSYDYAHNPSGEYKASNYLLTYFNNLTKKTEEDFFPSTVKLENFYDYNDTRLIYKKTVSSGNSTEEYYRNAKDKSIQKLINANILDLPVETEKKFNGRTVFKQEVKYENQADLFPSSRNLYNLNTGLMEREISYDKYDNKGNLLQYTRKDGVPVSLIWGYFDTYPLAKIEGLDHDTLMSEVFGWISNPEANDAPAFVNFSNFPVTPTSQQDLLNSLDNFRMHPYLKKYKITTYTYNPLVGITSITPPSGIRENYTYDSSNKLEKVTDINGKIVKEYKYNYAPQTYYSSAKSKMFTKNNCGSSGIGSSYTYTIPDYQYTSIVSQADADQKAQNDIDSNGQNAANANGTCTPVSCNLSFNTSIGISGGGSVGVSAASSYYQVSFGFSSGSNSVNLPWSTGVKIATITGVCRPVADYDSYNGQVYYTIKANGDIVIKKYGSVPNNSSYNYQFTFPIN